MVYIPKIPAPITPIMHRDNSSPHPFSSQFENKQFDRLHYHIQRFQNNYRQVYTYSQAKKIKERLKSLPGTRREITIEHGMLNVCVKKK